MEARGHQPVEHAHQRDALFGHRREIGTGTDVADATAVRGAGRGIEFGDRGGELGDEGIAEAEGEQEILSGRGAGEHRLGRGQESAVGDVGARQLARAGLCAG